jgi:hypothetical protein
VWSTCKIWNGPAFTGAVDGLAQVKRALDSGPGLLAIYNEISRRCTLSRRSGAQSGDK